MTSTGGRFDSTGGQNRVFAYFLGKNRQYKKYTGGRFHVKKCSLQDIRA